MHDGLPPIREVISRHRIRAKKALGQNFLNDFNLTRKIARHAGDLTKCDVVEIGPGPGGLTRALLAEGARRVVAIEADSACLPALEDIVRKFPGRLKVIPGDARSVDASTEVSPPVRIVANLPYNVGTRLLVDWIMAKTWPPYWQSMTLMFQREVAHRIVASPGRRQFGRLSVLAQWRCDARVLFEIPPEAFTPPPGVTSAVVHLERRQEPDSADRQILAQVTRLAFGQRRKMLRRSLKPLVPDIGQTLGAIGIPPETRAEQLSVGDFCSISRAVQRHNSVTMPNDSPARSSDRRVSDQGIS